MVESVGRIFLAVDLTPAARQILSRQVMLMGGGEKLPGRITPPHNWHMTLWFLGQIPRDRFEVMLHLLTETPLGGPFRCRFERLGTFPRASRASVLWVGISKGADSLSALAARVGESVEGSGLHLPERPFSAHLTVSRLRPSQDLRPLLASAPAAKVDMMVKEVTVFRSHLGGGPPRYEVMERAPLS